MAQVMLGYQTPLRLDKQERWEVQEALNTEHTIRPQPGDLWHEMLCALFLVVWTDGEHVEYLDRQIHGVEVDAGHWTWTFDKPACRRTVEAFSGQVHYGFELAHKTWCDVVPQARRHAWAVTEALDARRKRAP